MLDAIPFVIKDLRATLPCKIDQQSLTPELRRALRLRPKERLVVLSDYPRRVVRVSRQSQIPAGLDA